MSVPEDKEYFEYPNYDAFDMKRDPRSFGKILTRIEVTALINETLERVKRASESVEERIRNGELIITPPDDDAQSEP